MGIAPVLSRVCVKGGKEGGGARSAGGMTGEVGG